MVHTRGWLVSLIAYSGRRKYENTNGDRLKPVFLKWFSPHRVVQCTVALFKIIELPLYLKSIAFFRMPSSKPASDDCELRSDRFYHPIYASHNYKW